MRQNFLAQFVQLLKCWLHNVQSGVVVDKNWVLSIDKCQLRVLQFSVHFINLLSILLRCNGFTGIQKVVVDQTGSRPPAVTMTFFFWGGDASLALGSILEFLLSPATELIVTGCHIKSTFHRTSQYD